MDVRVVLLNPQEEENVGAVARVMKNFGFKELYLVNPCPIGRRAEALASHGVDVLRSAKTLSSFESAVRGCDYVVGTTGKKGGQKTKKREAVTPEDLRVLLTQGKAAIIFGNEAVGIPNEILTKTDFVVRIPTNPEYPILNLAQSACVVLYELAKRRYEKTVREKPLSREVRAQLDRFTGEITQRVYEQPHQQRATEAILQRVYGKAMLTKTEGGKMISFYRKIMAKL
jgi:TrmH family RNA methyltransferase